MGDCFNLQGGGCASSGTTCPVTSLPLKVDLSGTVVALAKIQPNVSSVVGRTLLVVANSAKKATRDCRGFVLSHSISASSSGRSNTSINRIVV